METAIALGTFDGLHAGHRAVLEQIKDFYGIAVTFEIPPKGAQTGDPQLLILPQDRVERIKELGVKRVDMQRFEDLKDVEANDYLELLKCNYNPKRIVCGFNYRFGKNATGDTDTLKRFCQENNIEFICVPPVSLDEKTLSSTGIRNLIRDGDIAKASSLMYGGFSFSAPVMHGDKRGRTLGFPTANQRYPNELVKPRFGVYLSCVVIDDKAYKAITNVGIRPTFKTETVGCETYIKGLTQEIYGKEIKLKLLNFIRPEQKFDSSVQLQKAVLNDLKMLEGE